MNATPLIPALLLTAVALLQLAMSTWSTLTPWKGGGFGMFASSDRPETRYLVVIGTDDVQIAYRIVIAFSPSHGTGPFTVNFERLVRTFPTPARLRVLARATLQAALMEVDAPDTLLAGRLAYSDNSHLLTLHALTKKELRLVGLRATKDTFRRLTEVRATVVSLRLNGDRRGAIFDTVATAVAGRDAR